MSTEREELLDSADYSARKNIIGHLEDLRSVILKSLVAVVIGVVASCVFLKQLFAFILAPYQSLLAFVDARRYQGIEAIRSLGPSETILISIKLIVIVAVILSLPVILVQVWRFVSPGLLPKERRSLHIVFIVSPLFFATGVAFAHMIVFPLALRFLWNYTIMMGVLPEWTITYYFNFAIGFLTAFGISFELPIVVILLAKLGLVTPHSLASKRRHAVVIVFILAALLTPPDVVSQVLLGIPMIALYELSILMARFVSKGKL